MLIEFVSAKAIAKHCFMCSKIIVYEVILSTFFYSVPPKIMVGHLTRWDNFDILPPKLRIWPPWPAAGGETAVYDVSDGGRQWHCQRTYLHNQKIHKFHEM